MKARTKTKIHKFFAVLTTLVQFQTQVVFAGMPMNVAPILTEQLKPLFQKIFGKVSHAGVSVYHAFPYTNLIDPRGRTDLPEEGRTAPDRLLQKEDQQMSVLRQLEELQVFQQETFQ